MSDTRPPLSTLLPLAARVLRLPFAKAPEAPDFPVVRAVQAHWEELRAGRLAPSRAEVEPRSLAACLDKVFVAELIAPGVARLRLAGQHLAELVGMEPRGMPLSVLFEGAGRDELASALKQVQAGARVVLPLRSDRAMGQPVMDGMLALMPLTDSKGQMTRVLGVLETIGPVGRAPRRFRTLAAPRETRPLVGKPALRVIAGGRA
jgi:hypothetical protein